MASCRIPSATLATGRSVTQPSIPGPAPTTGAGPRWSVVIPVHNCAGYLPQALAGPVSQLGGRPDAEIIVVDDHSADDPARVVRALGDGRVRFRSNPQRLGAVGTFNRCLELAGGDLVHLLHGDDAVLPGFYRAMERALDDPSVVAAICRADDVTSDTVHLHTTRSYRAGTGIWTQALEVLAVSNRVRAPGIVVRRSAYESLGGFRTDLPHAADWEMWTRLAAHGRIVFVDEVLARYRRHAASDTATRIRSGANIAERVAAIGIVGAHVAPQRRPQTTRKALLYAAAYGARSVLTCLRTGAVVVAVRQGREVLRCLGRLVATHPGLRRDRHRAMP